MITIVRRPEVVELAKAAGLELAAAFTLLEKESSGGLNVWGRDGVSTGGTYVKGSPVTRDAYLAYRAVREDIGYQGVGPCQLTWYSLQDRADALKGCWDWRSNVTVGFGLLADYVKWNGMRGGFELYNGSGPKAETYAAESMDVLDRWRSELAAPAIDLECMAPGRSTPKS